MRSPWDLPSSFLALGLLMVTAIYLAYLLFVRKKRCAFSGKDEEQGGNRLWPAVEVVNPPPWSE